MKETAPACYRAAAGFLTEARARGCHRVLDFGCGDGDLLRAGAGLGLEMFGVDNYGGDSCRSQSALAAARRDGLKVARPDEGRAIPYPDHFFDAIVSHQVLEHVSDLEEVVAAMHRALKPTGTMLHIFPTREVLFEDHVGLPLVHRMARGSGLRLRLAVCARGLGLGNGFGAGHKGRRQWAADALQWLDQNVHYRSWEEVARAFDAWFSVRSCTREQLLWHSEAWQGAVGLATRFRLRRQWSTTLVERLQWLRAGRAILCVPKVP